MTYTFTHSVECGADREFAWAFWLAFEERSEGVTRVAQRVTPEGERAGEYEDG